MTMNYDWFLPLLVFVGVAFAALWLYSSMDIVGGWPGAVAFVLLLFGIRIDLLRRQREKRDVLFRETVDWVENEVRVVYKGKSVTSAFKYAPNGNERDCRVDGMVIPETSPL